MSPIRTATASLQPYLLPTAILDFEHPVVVDFCGRIIADKDGDPARSAVTLYYAVRDGIRYDPYSPFYLPEHYRASAVLQRGKGYCVAKASLLCALGRACNIPSRLGFATVRNHLASRQLIDYLGSDRFVFHGYVEFYLDGRWVKATPAFNAELCERHRVDPLEFNGRDDAVFQAVNRENSRFMEYIEDLGKRIRDQSGSAVDQRFRRCARGSEKRLLRRKTAGPILALPGTGFSDRPRPGRGAEYPRWPLSGCRQDTSLRIPVCVR